ncbi:MAG: ParA family protein [Microthrixaceae bacterium]
MAKVLSVLNQKGGVGKTTVTLGLASAAQLAGDPVLVVDLDPQGSAGWAMGVEASDDHLSVGDVLRTGDPRVAEAATVTSGWGEGVDVLPASREPDRARGGRARQRRRRCGCGPRWSRWSGTTATCSSTARRASDRPPVQG